VLLRVGENKVKIKPALLVLVGAVIVGVVVTAVLRMTPSQQSPSFGYANPRGWRFEARQGAIASVVSAGDPAKPGVAKAAPGDGENGTEGRAPTVVDAENGFTVKVEKKGTALDSVYLRNAVNLDLNQDRHPIKLIFDARSGNGITPTKEPFPLTVTVRDTNELLYGKRVSVGPEWKTYTETIKLKKSALLNLILAVHLGEKTGAVQLRNVRVVD